MGEHKGGGNSKGFKKSFGNVRYRPSRSKKNDAKGRWQARYTGPDGIAYTVPVTFDTKGLAEARLSKDPAPTSSAASGNPRMRRSRSRAAPVTPRAYAEDLAGRAASCRPVTRKLYQITPGQPGPARARRHGSDRADAARRAEWHATLRNATGPTQRAHAYALLRTILNTALADDMIPANPCRVRGAGQAKTAPAHPARVAGRAGGARQAMPARYRLMVLLAAWCALRFGELAELRRSDIDVTNGIVHVRRGVIRGDGGSVVKGPKSDAGKRDVTIPPHLMPLVKEHLSDARRARQGRADVPRRVRRPHGAIVAVRGLPPGPGKAAGRSAVP